MQQGPRYWGASFIGSHTVERLLKEGIAVTVLDNLKRGSHENISRYKRKEGFLFVHGDIRDYDVVKKLTKDVDAIIHLAALTSIPESFQDPALYDEVNVTGTLNLLQASLNSDVKSVILGSSSVVYGDQEKLPIKEDNPLRPRSPYAITKMAAEYYMRLFFETYGLRTVCLRFFNVCGPRQPYNDYSGVITKFLSSIVEDRPILIYGDGKQTRDFVHVRDVVEAQVLAMKNNVAGESINIATGTATTIDELAKLLLELTNKTKTRITHAKPRNGDIRHSVADTSKAKTRICYTPRIPLRNGLRETAKHMLDQP